MRKRILAFDLRDTTVFDVMRPLEQALLIENYNYWAGQIGEDATNEHRLLAQSLPTTHTFPYFTIRETPSGVVSWPTWREILLDDVALLSEHERERKRPERTAIFKRHAEEARDANLFYFVFSYLGAHDGYYARTGVVDHPAFGVFISLDAEKSSPSDGTASAHATKRDLGSPEARSDREKLFLLAEHARELAARESSQDLRHKRDFWHYWGSTRYWEESGYQEQRWQWLFEFHFPKTVPLAKFAAVLWPCERKALVSGGSAVEYIGDGEAFRERHPNCHVIQYFWESRFPTKCFLRASELATRRYFASGGQFPDRID